MVSFCPSPASVTDDVRNKATEANSQNVPKVPSSPCGSHQNLKGDYKSTNQSYDITNSHPFLTRNGYGIPAAGPSVGPIFLPFPMAKKK